MSKPCTVAGCEQGILDEFDVNTREGEHTTQDEMLDLIHDLSEAYDYNKSSHDLASTLYDLRCMALRLLTKIEGGGDNG